MDSLWIDTAEKPHFDSLSGDINTDVLIVGGGLTGILCAYMLHDSGIDHTLIEAKEICGGITKNTTAKITAQHGLIYHKIINMYGENAAKQYYSANSRAIDRYRQICKSLDVSFDVQDAFVYCSDTTDTIEKELLAYNKIGISTDLQRMTSLPFAASGAIRLKGQGQIHPLELLYKLSAALNIKEHTKLINITGTCAETNRGRIHFKKAIIATHFPVLNKHGLYFLKMYQDRSYVIALKNAQKLDGMYVDESSRGLSFRNYGEHLLLGGGSHRTGKKGGGWAELEAFARKYYPNAEIKYKWATQDCMTLDGLPYIGNYSKSTPNLFVATGYNKWGFTSAMAAAEILCRMIKGKQSKYAELFSPSRSIMHPQLALNGAEALLSLITPTAPRCPHMGCALKYNSAEHTWDCPCHGSRFAEDGALIDNPSTDDKIL